MNENVIELDCRECKRDLKKDLGIHAQLVLHRFNLAGELIDTIVVPYTNGD